jgi:hypothetical protein
VATENLPGRPGIDGKQDKRVIDGQRKPDRGRSEKREQTPKTPVPKEKKQDGGTSAASWA